MYDYGIVDLSRTHQDDMQREAEKMRRGIEIHGLPPQIDHTLPNWVGKLLARSPFGHRNAPVIDRDSHVN